MTTQTDSTITDVQLINANKGNNALLVQEQKIVICDLIEKGQFQPLNDNKGPYKIALSIEERRLVLRMRNQDEEELSMLVLALKPYKRLIQDYFMMIESHEKARRSATREKLEAIDMGRRGIHNEGATLLQDRLKDKISMDFETARHFFTLICALHVREHMLSL